MRDLFAHVDAVLASLPPELHFKRPQIPSSLTESIAAYLLNSGRLGTRLTVTPSRSGGDLEASTVTGTPAKLEVKGTGAAAFQQIGPKDRAADVLVWLHFDDFFSRPERESITVHLLGKPGAVLPKGDRIQLTQFLQLPGVLSAEVNIVELLGLPRTSVVASSSAGRDA